MFNTWLFWPRNWCAVRVRETEANRYTLLSLFEIKEENVRYYALS